jgi:hypothetical protein
MAQKRQISRITHRGGAIESPAPAAASAPPAAKSARLPPRETDVPMDDIASAYTPAQTSLKASFRSDGRDQQSDQEYAKGAADTRWNDEDRRGVTPVFVPDDMRVGLVMGA